MNWISKGHMITYFIGSVFSIVSAWVFYFNVTWVSFFNPILSILLTLIGILLFIGGMTFVWEERAEKTGRKE